MNFGQRYEPKSGDTIEDMLLYFEMERLKYIDLQAKYKTLQNKVYSVPTCCMECVLEYRKDLLKELGEND